MKLINSRYTDVGGKNKQNQTGNHGDFKIDHGGKQKHCNQQNRLENGNNV